MLLLIGIDDTDMPDTRGTNQLAREIVRRAAPVWTCQSIVRHQLLDDPRVPYTSKNGSASIALRGPDRLADLIDLCRQTIGDWFIPGSDPGLCVTPADQVQRPIIDYAHRCRSELITQEIPRTLAEEQGLHLEGLGGTEGGVIGALAAVGLAREGDSGRIVQWREWPDDLSGPQPVSRINERSIQICERETGIGIATGVVDVGKHLRPNVSDHQAVLYVQRKESADDQYVAMKLH